MQTDRLIIRKISYQDDQGFYEMCSDVQTAVTAGWKPHDSITTTRNIITVCMYDEDTYSIILKDTNEFIGTISLYKDENKRDCEYRELGFCLNKHFRNKGYMYEACVGMIKYAFTNFKLDLLMVEVAKFNESSKKLIEKLPFKYEGCIRGARRIDSGELCDVLSYSITNEEYEREIK